MRARVRRADVVPKRSALSDKEGIQHVLTTVGCMHIISMCSGVQLEEKLNASLKIVNWF